MAVVNTFIPGLSSHSPHYIPGYTGHCPLLRFSMGQPYGQVTGQLLRGAPGVAWPPARRTLLPPIRSPQCPVISRLPPRRGHERLGSHIIPGYTGFIPQAQFIFAKNCNQVWAEAMNDFTQRCGEQASHELPREAKGEREEKGHGPEAEEPVLKQTVGQASPYSMDDTDPQKFFMSGFTGYVPRARFFFGSGFPVLTNQALQEFGQTCSRGRAPKDPKPLSPLPRPSFQSLGLLPHYGGYIPGEKRLWDFGNSDVCAGGLVWGTGMERCSFREDDWAARRLETMQLAEKEVDFSCLWLHVTDSLGHTGYKFQFGGTFGHLTHDALGLSTTQRQPLA